MTTNKKKKRKTQQTMRYIQGALWILLLVAMVTIIFACVKHFRNAGKGTQVGGEISDVPTPSATETPEPTPTQTPTPEPTETPTPVPTETPTPTPTPEAEGGTPKPTKKPDQPVDPNAPKRVAFTFDDGPMSSLTLKFAEKLEEYGGHGTWFVIGNRISDVTGPQLATLDRNGHEVAIHAYTHQHMFHECDEATYRAELSKTDAAIRKYVDKPISLMRPVGGSITNARASECPYAVILWSVDSNDWRYKQRTTETQRKENVDKIVNNVMSSVKDGSIVLMHEIYENSYEAFCIIADRLAAQGYEFVTVSELLNNPTPGYKYYKR